MRRFHDAELICFDNDGTLFRSEEVANPAIQRTFLRYVREHGLELDAPSDEEIQALTGQPGPIFYREILPASLRDRTEEFRALCIEEEVREIHARGRFYEGIEELLLELRSRGRKLALVTNGGARYIGAIAERLSYDRLLDGIYHYGKDGLARKSAMIQRAREEIGARNALMVGDRASDVEGAREAGVPCILCRYGFGAPEESLGADAVVDSVAELRLLLLGDGQSAFRTDS